MDNTVTTQLVETALVLLLPVLAALAGALTRSVVLLLRTRLTAEQLVIVGQVASTVVAAVEQTGLDRTAEAKKAEAVSRAESALAARGIVVDLEQLDDAIEAAVLRELNLNVPPQFRRGS